MRPVFLCTISGMKRACLILLLASAAVAQSPAPTVNAPTANDSLRQGFLHPPQSAKPRVWWHWMNGNISKEGIRLDLEWMHRVGVGGFQNFDAALSTPQVVEKRLAYMTPEWKDAFKYATTLADQLGLEEAIAGSPGWSETGGPWVSGPQAMKKYVWSETVVDGGKPFTGTLNHPPTVTGPFQNLPVANPAAFAEPQFYADSAVVAYRAAASDVPLESLHPEVTSSGGAIDAAMLSDGDLTHSVTVPRATEGGGTAWIQFAFSQPQTIRSLTLATSGGGAAGPDATLEASDDGQNFHQAVAIPNSRVPERTISFAPVTAKYFRVSFPPARSVARVGEFQSRSWNCIPAHA